MSVKTLHSMNDLDTFLKENNRAVIDFWAEWCGPCRALAPIFEEVSNEVQGLGFGKLNIENAQEAGERFGISSIPCLIIFENGTEKKRILGLQSKETLKEKLQ